MRLLSCITSFKAFDLHGHFKVTLRKDVTLVENTCKLLHSPEYDSADRILLTFPCANTYTWLNPLSQDMLV